MFWCKSLGIFKNTTLSRNVKFQFLYISTFKEATSLYFLVFYAVTISARQCKSLICLQYIMLIQYHVLSWLPYLLRFNLIIKFYIDVCLIAACFNSTIFIKWMFFKDLEPRNLVNTLVICTLLGLAVVICQFYSQQAVTKPCQI